jgi:hypothetical protein
MCLHTFPLITRSCLNYYYRWWLQDLSELGAADLQTAGFKPLHARRLLDAIGRWDPGSRRTNTHASNGLGANSLTTVATEPTSAASTEVSAASGPIEWEEYATSDGFMYYHNVSACSAVYGEQSIENN